MIRATRYGFEMRVLADSPEVGKYGGIRTRRKILSLMALSGGIAALRTSPDASAYPVPGDRLSIDDVVFTGTNGYLYVRQEPPEFFGSDFLYGPTESEGGITITLPPNVYWVELGELLRR